MWTKITKEKVVSSFGRFDWHDQWKARATLLAASRERKRERKEGDFFQCPLRRKVLSKSFRCCC